jgi:hypothetical protein
VEGGSLGLEAGSLKVFLRGNRYSVLSKRRCVAPLTFVEKNRKGIKVQSTGVLKHPAAGKEK